MTTRRQDVALTRRDHRIVSVDNFTASESLSYLAAKLSGTGDDRGDRLGEAPALAEDLGHLPLALGLAAAVIANDAISCQVYRQRFSDRSRSLEELFPDNAGDDYPRAVAATRSLAADRANALWPRGIARHVLHLAAVLDSNGAPDLVFRADAARRYLEASWHSQRGDAIGTRSLSADDARRGLRNLHRLSLLHHDPEGGPVGVKMHALAQRAAIDELSHDEIAAAARAAASALLEVWPGVRDVESSQALRANAEAVLADTGLLRDRDGFTLAMRSGPASARSAWRSKQSPTSRILVARTTTLLGADDPRTLQARYSLAKWRGEAGDLAGAEAAFAQLRDDCAKSLRR